MIYVMLGVLVAALISFFIYKMKAGDRRANDAVKMGSLLTGLLFVLRFAPNMLANLLMLVPALLHILRQQEKADISSLSATNIAMTVERARQILDVSAGASHEEVSAAFKKMMLKNHPDQGGSRYIAEQLISAKEILLKQTR
ncbi:MAG: hypothetical protein JSS50_01490 [Proteobacteria bacterium]|nr:hypothetical protein [Pseudomonadota bacterium]